MATEVRACPAELLGEVVGLVDHVFLETRGRRISFAKRYPTVFVEENCANIAVVIVDGHVVATAAAKPLRWALGQTTAAGAMIGGVATGLAFRGRGYARAALRWAEAHLNGRAIDFAVLWTSIPALYRSLGWFTADSGLFGKLEAIVPHAPRHDVTRLDGAAVPYQTIEALRAECLPARTLRRPGDYAALPLPADAVDCYVARRAAEWRAYALVGRHDDEGFVYEVVGDTEAWACLFTAMAGRHKRLYVNASTGSPLVEWLQDRATVRWQRQSLAMWKMFAPRFAPDDVSRIHIPYLDRI